MNIGAFMQRFRSESINEGLKRVDKELEKQVAAFEAKSANMQALKRTQGWKEYEKFMDERVEMLRRKRDYLVAGSEEDINAKAQILAYQDILMFSDNWSQ